jgi:hypothetical protein
MNQMKNIKKFKRQHKLHKKVHKKKVTRVYIVQ